MVSNLRAHAPIVVHEELNRDCVDPHRLPAVDPAKPPSHLAEFPRLVLIHRALGCDRRARPCLAGPANTRLDLDNNDAPPVGREAHDVGFTDAHMHVASGDAIALPPKMRARGSLAGPPRFLRVFEAARVWGYKPEEFEGS